MKDKVLIFIIGLLVGAIITAAGFLIYEKVNQNTNQMPSGDQMQMMERPDGEEPPEKPSDTDDDGDRPEPPSKNDSSTSSNAN